MTLTAGDALHDLVLPVSGLDRPPRALTWLRSRDVVFAVHRGVPSAGDGSLLGVVGWSALARFPERIFADLVPPTRPAPVHPSCPLQEVIQRFEEECCGELAVVDDDGRFRGAVTRGSSAIALLTSGGDCDGSWQRLVRRLHQLEAYVLRVEATAHDLANALVSVNAQAQLEALGAPPDDDVQEASLASTRHALALLKRLRQAGAEDYRAEVVTGHDLFQGLLRQARPLLPPGVELVVQVDAPDASLCIDRTDLERAVANLVANAAEAMPGGGQLSLKLDRVILDQPGRDVLGHPIEARAWTRISVADTGHGMEEQQLRSAFLPLWSTRTGSSRGMGLSITQRMVRRNGGALRCESQPGQGTVFEILL